MIYNIPYIFRSNNYGERKVHNKFKTLFEGKKYFALHSVKLRGHKTKVNGECDFVLISDRGILCLEVKGSSSVNRTNAIDRTDGIKDKDLWIYDTYDANESPFNQAEGAIYPINKILSEDNQNRRNKFVIGHGVIFTEFEFNYTSSEWDEKEVCTKSKFNNHFENYLKDLFDHFHTRLYETKNIEIKNTPNIDDLKWAIKKIRPNVSELSLLELNVSKDEIILLEEKQKLFVDQLVYSNDKRSIIDGSAGSGKTVILLETIHRLSEDEQILMVCFNKQLSEYLAYRIKHKTNVQVYYYTSLMEYYCKLAEKKYEGNKNDEYFKDILPNLFLESLIKLENKVDKFDWLLVDEGQDFINETSFNNLVELLKNEKKGNYVLAFDSGLQSGVYDRMDTDFLKKLKEDAHTLNLYRNFRNPRSLAQRSATITGIKKPEFERQIISTPKIYELQENENLRDKINDVVKSILASGVAARDITILTFKNRASSILSSFKSIGGKNILDMKIKNIWDEKDPDNFITWSTVSSYKGMENEYIILIEADFNEFNDWYKSCIYVAMTRVKFEFIYIGKKNDNMINIIKNVEV